MSIAVVVAMAAGCAAVMAWAQAIDCRKREADGAGARCELQ